MAGQTAERSVATQTYRHGPFGMRLMLSDGEFALPLRFYACWGRNLDEGDAAPRPSLNSRRDTELDTLC